MKKIIRKTPEQIRAITEAWKYLTELLMLIRDHTRPGVSGLELEEIAAKFLSFHSLRGSFKGYNWFPANLCLSVNDCLVHGIPDATIYKEWDLLKIDAGVTYDGCIADAAISIIVWWAAKNPQWQALIKATKHALDSGLAYVWPRKELFNFGKHIESTLHQAWFSIIRNLTGHGVWTAVHEAPYIYNRANPQSRGVYFEEGMVIALEPITAVDSQQFTEMPGNHRNLYTDNGDLGAQREYTIVITADGYKILAGVQELE